jgi:hypothetical protein
VGGGRGLLVTLVLNVVVDIQVKLLARFLVVAEVLAALKSMEEGFLKTTKKLKKKHFWMHLFYSNICTQLCRYNVKKSFDNSTDMYEKLNTLAGFEPSVLS